MEVIVTRLGPDEPENAEGVDLAFGTLRLAVVIGASQWLLVAAVMAIGRLLPVLACVALGGAGVVYSLFLVHYFDRRRRVSATRLTGPIGGEVGQLGQRLPVPRKLRRGVGFVLVSEIAAVALLMATQPWGSDSCAAAGISTLAAREGTCTRDVGAFGGTTVYTVVNSGHLLRMPGYDARLLGSTLSQTHVYGPVVNATDYPGGEGLLVSFEVAVTNGHATPLSFDATGQDVDLFLSSPGDTMLGRPQVLHPVGAPYPQLALEGAIPATQTVTGWVSFVAPLWARPWLNARASDLEFYRPGNEDGYVGQIRLWKWANAQGRAAVAFGQADASAIPPLG